MREVYWFLAKFSFSRAMAYSSRRAIFFSYYWIVVWAINWKNYNSKIITHNYPYRNIIFLFPFSRICVFKNLFQDIIRVSLHYFPPFSLFLLSLSLSFSLPPSVSPFSTIWRSIPGFRSSFRSFTLLPSLVHPPICGIRCGHFSFPVRRYWWFTWFFRRVQLGRDLQFCCRC